MVEAGRGPHRPVPDIADAAASVPAGTVVDGEAVAWNGDRLAFELLQQRLVTSAAKAAGLRRRHPASFVAFDLLAREGVALRKRPWRDRRRQLEDLSAQWHPPLQITPTTGDVDEARTWFDALRPMGVEGLVVKGEATPYRPGRHDWIKVKSRVTTEVVVGGCSGRSMRPRQWWGLWQGGVLGIVGRTTRLSSKQSAILGLLLEPASGDHPWPDEINAAGFGRGGKVSLIKVEPRLVAEVAVDAAMQGSHYRHSLRFMTLRADLSSSDLHEAPDEAAQT